VSILNRVTWLHCLIKKGSYFISQISFLIPVTIPPGILAATWVAYVNTINRKRADRKIRYLSDKIMTRYIWEDSGSNLTQGIGDFS
jgi:hypothetical protein